MSLNQLYKLKTKGGDAYALVYASRVDRWMLRWGSGAYDITPPSRLNKVLHQLGGMVEWDVWSEETQDILLSLNGGVALRQDSNSRYRVSRQLRANRPGSKEPPDIMVETTLGTIDLPRDASGKDAIKLLHKHKFLPSLDAKARWVVGDEETRLEVIPALKGSTPPYKVLFLSAVDST